MKPINAGSAAGLQAGTPTRSARGRAPRSKLAELRADARRLDFLEREVRDEPLTLHNVPAGEPIRASRGLGLACTNRSLRDAIDDLMKVYPKKARR